MKVLYVTNNTIQPYCTELYVVPLLIILFISLIIGVEYINHSNITTAICFIITIVSFIGVIICTVHEEQQGYKYYVVLEENEQIDLTKYDIEEQKGDLYIITDK